MSTAATPALRLLGAPSWRTEGGELPLVAERPHQLLALLACRRGWVPRGELAELLWPERSQRLARNNLRTLLLRAQKLAQGVVVEQQSDRLRWLPDSDLLRFEAALAQQQHAQVLSLYRGPLLQAMDDGLSEPALQWLQFERERLASCWRGAAAQCLAAASGPDDAVRLAESIIALDPFNETALAALVHARVAQQRPAEASRALHAHAARLAADHGLDTSAVVRELTRNVDALTAARIAAVPAAATPARSAAGFVGRRLELAHAQDLLRQPECRVLTFTGPGGVGKSSLARAVLPLQAPGFAGGAAWVALDDLATVAEVPGRLAAVLGVVAQAGGDAWHGIARHIGTRKQLLVTDNAEHLDGLGSRLATLLQSCPGLKLINTSRTRLGVAGEWLLPLDGLPLPDVTETDAELLRLCDSVRLFDGRARALHPVFDLAAQAADVVALVHAVQGLPLAIELAAAWVRLLPVGEIVAELARSLDLLCAEGQAPERERSLRASFAHSWSLLAGGERTALARLALLPGVFGREMAQQVAGCGLPMLAALADKSLLQADGHGRFGLHPLVRQCAAEHAHAGACDSADVRQRHMDHMTQWLARLGATPNSRSRDAEMQQALPHVRVAWAWAVDHGEPAIVVAASAARLTLFYARHGLLAEGLQALRRAADAVAGNHTAAAARAAMHAAFGQADLLYRGGELEGAEPFVRQAMKQAARLRDTLLAARCLTLLGLTLTGRGRYADARPVFEQGLAQARRFGHDDQVELLLGALGLAHKGLGQYDAAETVLVEALSLARRRRPPDPDTVVSTTNNLANLNAARGRWEAALPLLLQALADCDAQVTSIYHPVVLLNLARAHVAMGHLGHAQRPIERGLELARLQGQGVMECDLHVVRARLGVVQGDSAAVLVALAKALRIAERLKLGEPQIRCVMTYAELLTSQGQTAPAAALWQWAGRLAVMAAEDRAVIESRLQSPAIAAALAAGAGAATGVPVDGSLLQAAAWLAERCASGGAAAPDVKR